jgi:hypothetical protein
MAVTGMQHLTSTCRLCSFNNHVWIYVITTPTGSLSYPSLFHLLIVGVEVYCCAWSHLVTHIL